MPSREPDPNLPRHNRGLASNRLFVLALSTALLPFAASAQQWQQGRHAASFEGFVNLSTGHDDGAEGNGFGELRAFLTTDTGHNLLLGPRVTVRGEAGTGVSDGLRIGEASLIALGSWGRLELGDRRGLPDVLTGYAPNNYQFVSAEYGPASGPSLDPDGGQQTALLDTEMAKQIVPLSGLGITASFFGDESTKLIYALPKTRGFQGGLSYAPRVDGVDDRFRDLVQAGLTWESYHGQSVFRFGGTYTYADGQTRGGGALYTDNLHSISLGGSTTLNDALTLGVSATWNGDSGLTRSLVEPAFRAAAYGYAASVNYNTGSWTLGGFAQRARGEGDSAQQGRDELKALQLGVSHRSSTHLRLFAAMYLYRFEDEGGRGSRGRRNGAVPLAGIRASF
jgi:hypothetical protein